MDERKCRNRPRIVALVAFGAAALLTQTGCLRGTEFRTVAGPAIQTGVTSIVNGLLDGLFAIIEPDLVSESSGA